MVWCTNRIQLVGMREGAIWQCCQCSRHCQY